MRSAIQRLILNANNQFVIFVYGPQSGDPGILVFMGADRVGETRKTNFKMEFKGNNFFGSATYFGTSDCWVEITLNFDGVEYKLTVKHDSHTSIPESAFRFLPFDGGH